jgi:hypothetical protein
VALITRAAHVGSTFTRNPLHRDEPLLRLIASSPGLFPED